MQNIQNIRDKLKRKLSMHDKNPSFDEAQEPEDVDDETAGHLSKEIDKASEAEEPHGKPGSFLHRLIMHGNKKTEEQLAKEAALSKENAKPGSSTAGSST